MGAESNTLENPKIVPTLQHGNEGLIITDSEILKEMLKPKVLSLVQDLFSMTESEELSPAAPIPCFRKEALGAKSGAKMTFLGITVFRN